MIKDVINSMSSVFDPQILLRGEDYFKTGHVLNVRFSEGLLKARVKGSANRIYDVHMDLKIWPRKPASCTCSYQTNCKHAAACCFALREKEHVPDNFSDTLEQRFNSWLKELRTQEQSQHFADEKTHQLLYMLDYLPQKSEALRVELYLAKIFKKGSLGRRTKIHHVEAGHKRHFTPEDNAIVAQLLFSSSSRFVQTDYPVTESKLLQDIITTGRAFFAKYPEQPIHLGEPLEASCEWMLTQKGSQKIVLKAGQELIEPVLLSDAAWYVDEDGAQVGLIHTSHAVGQLRHLLQLPEIPLDQTEQAIAAMGHLDFEFPKPQIFQQQEFQHIEPIPTLILDGEQTPPLAFICFDYQGILVRFSDEIAPIKTQGEVLISYSRRHEFEREKLQELKQFLKLEVPPAWARAGMMLDLTGAFILDDDVYEQDSRELHRHIIPQLKARGWVIRVYGHLFEEIILADEVAWYSELEEQGNDFFAYQLGILIDNKPVTIVPLVAELIKQYPGVKLDALPDDEVVQLTMEEGKRLEIKLGRIKPLVRLIMQFGSQPKTSLEINKYQLILMEEIEKAVAATAARWQGAPQIREKLKKFADLKTLPVIPKPQGLNAHLRDYQHEGLNWAQFLRSCGFGGVLADDMGLGKTIQTLALLQHEQEQSRMKYPSLIITPTSLVNNWVLEAKRFTPQLKILLHHGNERDLRNAAEYDVIISTYGLIQRDQEYFKAQRFYYLILDEAQFIKNARTKTTQIIQQLSAAHRLCLTGTPLENHLGELWSLFHFLMPGLLGDRKQFGAWFKNPIEKQGQMDRREVLLKRIQPFLLRRTKREVAKELPDKTVTTLRIELLGPQRDLYEAIRMSMEKKVRDAIAKQGLGKSHIILLDALLKLRQVCCDPRLLSLPEAQMAHGTSCKLEALLQLLDNLIEEGRRILLFSQFTSMLDLIEEQVIMKKYTYLKLTGQTRKRQELVDEFQQGKTSLFLISLKAGGTGLNLTKADAVIHFDPWWNPAVEDQATDRTHRIGQENPVFVYKLITKGTVEEAILSMQERKRQLVEGILHAEPSQMKTLSTEDLDQFFMPL